MWGENIKRDNRPSLISCRGSEEREFLNYTGAMWNDKKSHLGSIHSYTTYHSSYQSICSSCIIRILFHMWDWSSECLFFIFISFYIYNLWPLVLSRSFGDLASTMGWVEIIGWDNGEAWVSYGDNYKSFPYGDNCSTSRSGTLALHLYFEII